MGKTRKQMFTNQQIGVKFDIMKDTEMEKYLGDMIGNEASEDARFGESIKKIQKTGADWNRMKIGVYGRTIVANTLLLSKIKYRAE